MSTQAVHARHADSSRLAPGEEHFFVGHDGLTYAGMHLIVDMWGASRLDDLQFVRRALENSIDQIGATLLRIDLHHFEVNGGISGVAILAESHMSIHTWPEESYAALDVFVCGGCNPHRAVPVLRNAFSPTHMQCTEIKRGLRL